MARYVTAEQEVRFERFCAILDDDPWLNAYRAAITAGYTARMAKSKSYLLLRRAEKRPGFGRAARAALAAAQARLDEQERSSELVFEAFLANLIIGRIGR